VMATKRKPMTASQLATKLQADPEFVARVGERERERDKHAALLASDEQPLLDELHEAGYNVLSVWDLVNTATKYERAIPILVKHLRIAHLDRTKEGIARALAVPEARVAWHVLAEEYRKAPHRAEGGVWLGAKDGLAAALAATASEAVLVDLIELAMDVTNGTSRVLLLSPLRRSKNQLAVSALSKLISDPELAAEIASWRRG
jgi:hypothetical protein